MTTICISRVLPHLFLLSLMIYLKSTNYSLSRYFVNGKKVNVSPFNSIGYSNRLKLILEIKFHINPYNLKLFFNYFYKTF